MKLVNHELNPYEFRYVRVAGAIGISMLSFLLFFHLGTSLYQAVAKALVKHFSSFVAYHVTMELFYGAIYLAAFLLPVLILRFLIRAKGYPIRPMRASMRLSPYLPLIILASVMIIRSSAHINALWTSLLDFSSYYSVGVLSGKAELMWYQILLQFLIGCLIPGICEEILFRGAIQSNCMPFGRTNAILIASVLFALMHESAAQIFYTFVAGILFGIVYDRTENLLNCIILHTFNNAFSLIDDVIYFNFTKNAILKLAIYEGVLTLLGLFSAVVLILRFARKREDLGADKFVSCPITHQNALQLFLTPTVVLFSVLTVFSILSF